MPIIKTLLKSFKRLFKKKPRLFKLRKRSFRLGRPKRKTPAKRIPRSKPPKVSRKKKNKRPPKARKPKPHRKVVLKTEGVVIGEVTHFFSRIQVIVLKMTDGTLAVGERIHIKGKRTSFIQPVESLQIESVDVKQARKGQLVGLKVKKKAQEGDKVYKLL